MFAARQATAGPVGVERLAPPGSNTARSDPGRNSPHELDNSRTDSAASTGMIILGGPPGAPEPLGEIAGDSARSHRDRSQAPSLVHTTNQAG